MATTNVVKPIALTNIDSSTLSASYQAINASGLTFPCFEVIINNASNQDVTISLDGTHDHFYVVKATTLLIASQTNSRPNNFVADFAQGTIFYAKGTAGTGNIYLSGLYQPTEHL